MAKNNNKKSSPVGMLVLTIIFAKLFGALMGKLMSLTTKEKNK